MESHADVAIIGAGPYGLSLASYLRHLNLDFRIFGTPMAAWRYHMPKGMQLKSTGFSSTLYAPASGYSLGDYCAERGIPYQDVGLPVRIETFCDYALEFQRRFVPNLEQETVTSLRRSDGGFRLTFKRGLSLCASSVVVAVGLGYFKHIPGQFAGLAKERCLHSSEFNDPAGFRGERIAVIGGGSSAIDVAALLYEHGAFPTLITRRQCLEWGVFETAHRSLLARALSPMSGVGPGWKNRMTTDLIGAFPYLPGALRLKIVREFLGPGGGWFMKDRLKPVPQRNGYEVVRAGSHAGGVTLEMRDVAGNEDVLTVDRVILGTGYRSDIARLTFLDKGVIGRLKRIGKTPALSTRFESSIAGLYFVGPISSTTFGPSMRFSLGAEFTAKTLSRHLANQFEARDGAYSENVADTAG